MLLCKKCKEKKVRTKFYISVLILFFVSFITPSKKESECRTEYNILRKVYVYE